MEYTLHLDGQTYGPVDEERLVADIRAGRIPRRMLVWRSGRWVAIAEVAVLADAFAPVRVRARFRDPAGGEVVVTDQTLEVTKPAGRVGQVIDQVRKFQGQRVAEGGFTIPLAWLVKVETRTLQGLPGGVEFTVHYRQGGTRRTTGFTLPPGDRSGFCDALAAVRPDLSVASLDRRADPREVHYHGEVKVDRRVDIRDSVLSRTSVGRDGEGEATAGASGGGLAEVVAGAELGEVTSDAEEIAAGASSKGGVGDAGDAAACPACGRAQDPEWVRCPYCRE